MIKINLANSILKKSDSKAGGNLLEGKMIRDSAIKIALVIAPVLGFMYYEKTDLESKSGSFNQLVAEREKLSAELKNQESVDEIVKQVELQQKEMDDKLHVMEQIFGLRSRKIQALSLLQKHILQSVWLEKLHVHEELAAGAGVAAKTVVNISGYGMSIEDIQIFSTALSQEKAVFEKVRAPNISAEDTQKPDVKKFTFDVVLQD